MSIGFDIEKYNYVNGMRECIPCNGHTTHEFEPFEDDPDYGIYRCVNCGNEIT